MGYCAAAAAGAFALPAAEAADEISLSNARGIVDVFSPTMIEAYFNEIGIVYERMDSSDGKVLYFAHPKGAEGARFFAVLHACKDGDLNQCYGLEYVAFFETPSKYQTADAMNRGNMSAPFVKIMLMEDGKTILSRYVISDAGITRGNVLLNMLVFFAQASALAKAYGDEGGRQVFLKPPTSNALGAHGIAALPKGAVSEPFAKLLTTHPDWINSPRDAKDWINSPFAAPKN
ncbi:MAG: YbjN domain-containing protein [Alphaproteobacteria bacterium]